MILQAEQPQSDWGSAIDTSTLCGRSEELMRLKQSVLEEQCRLVLLLGIGGIGKSSLAAKLVQLIQSEFEVVVWRSLQNAPPLEEWLEGVLPVLLQVQGEDMVNSFLTPTTVGICILVHHFETLPKWDITIIPP
ncbi:myosin-heavy-chain kinase [Scytonema sp. HK-05]|uniref:ATP-binding protein n=1 Tax=Scytonema sp. HK-05 TaxID=1137095 RepID=UPI00093759DF|nr:ATP-binding protein [Scytonema sp. HK-05]OKH56173.1 hypothetical protein NIES2130_25425 [Scytonema sp. HK-05]BAY49378.1 myosin-heavy-chain kinase [Scytonema sp. HK-05]